MLKRSKKRKPPAASRPVAQGKPIVGWREWASLPDLGINRIKVKIDTGARTSALHAFDVFVFRRMGKSYIRFKVHPLQRETRRVVECEALLLEWRHVTDSGGKRTLRPVIETILTIGQREVQAEVTLISRDDMGFRMLIGRQALTGMWLVDPARSYISDKDMVVNNFDTSHSKTTREEE